MNSTSLKNNLVNQHFTTINVAILDYSTSSVEILYNLKVFGQDCTLHDIEMTLDRMGYDLDEISYMTTTENFKIKCEDVGTKYILTK